MANASGLYAVTVAFAVSASAYPTNASGLYAVLDAIYDLTREGSNRVISA